MTMKFQTVERDSIFTRLDFRPKIFMMLVLTIVALIWESPVVQLAMAFIILIACVLSGVKMKFIRTADMGYAREQIITLPVRGDSARRNIEAIKAELMRYPDILAVSTSARLPAVSGSSTNVRSSAASRCRRIESP